MLKAARRFGQLALVSRGQRGTTRCHRNDSAVIAQPTLDQKIGALKPKVPDEFSRDVLDGARHALADTENPLRYNFFSTAIRILLEHIMDTLAPNDEVPRSKWFKPETASGRPTRGQRIVFA
jgi:hypothetical protein